MKSTYVITAALLLTLLGATSASAQTRSGDSLLVSKSDIQHRAAIKATTERILELRNAMLVTRQGQVDLLNQALTEHDRKDVLQDQAMAQCEENVKALEKLYLKQDKKLDRRRFWGRAGWLVAGTLAVVLIAQ